MKSLGYIGGKEGIRISADIWGLVLQSFLKDRLKKKKQCMEKKGEEIF